MERSRQRKIIKKILQEDRESPLVTGDQSSDDVAEVVDNDHKKIWQYIEIQTPKLKLSKQELYSLMESIINEDNQSEYCSMLRQVDA